jgi:hypothetical protein
MRSVALSVHASSLVSAEVLKPGSAAPSRTTGYPELFPNAAAYFPVKPGAISPAGELCTPAVRCTARQPEPIRSTHDQRHHLRG